ncbi:MULTISPECIES: hypothetical protein [Virgibacillus]|uniref:Uncharacterized protein n=2 Tax=Virgibacillus TaxID=84406 RepID=A0A024QDC9_9BACI|nr:MULTISPECIES: hypothetical protein [Virgibacillus]EQB35324.1 hypothetical protein M948_19685 [Virgibacillus sp. CM-4]MYL42649.1 hypothetical protein [Virgibacillus massiliensis]GGJ75732.1 hypothetical protein GCM10007111_41610 [Virgibacillus kapii]CDQ40533.1 hypothetical protein BN990_02858 [Virgibacillus massiliensis]
MNTFKGPFRVMFEDLRVQFYILTTITAVLSIFYIILGMLFSSDGSFNAGASFGPYYGMFLIYPFFIFTKGFKYIISFGGTRKQFLFSAFINAGIFILIGSLVLNGLYVLNNYLIEQGISSGTLFHMGDLVNESGFFLYLWVDILWGIFLFGIGFLINSVWQYFGTFRLLMGSTVVLLLLITYVTFGDISKVIQFIVVDHLAFVHIVAGFGIVAFIISYFLIKDGPIERGAVRLFRNKVVSN